MPGNRQMTCPRCGKEGTIDDPIRGERVCYQCGSVIEENHEHQGPEWRMGDNGQSRSRVGSPVSLAMHDMGLNTVIGSGGRDAFGSPIPYESQQMIGRLRLWNRRSSTNPSEEKNFRQAFAMLESLRDKLALPDAVVEETAYLYRKAYTRKLCKGRSTAAVLTASVYAACRRNEIPHPLSEISMLADIDWKILGRTYRRLLQDLDIPMPVADPAKCLNSIASKTSTSEKTRRTALDVLDNAKRIGLSAGKEPVVFAVAALYLACLLNGESKQQRNNVLSYPSTTETAVRTRCKELRELLNL